MGVWPTKPAVKENHMSLNWLPNALTILRILAAPVVALFVWRALAAENFSEKELFATVAFVLFAIAALSDWLDGALARMLNASSALGAKLDLWADKFLVLTVLLASLPFLPVLAILGLVCLSARDIYIMRLRAKHPGIDLKATFLAKSKTAIVMGGMGVAMLGYALAMGALAQSDESLARSMLVIARIGLSLFVFGCILSLGTAYEYVAATRENPDQAPKQPPEAQE